ncbi:MAG TPA: MarR family transcriptional regulator [Bdellovibrionota bacterium]|jgi:DNA-binding MarR family transcriptional regulator|nr:MarR family transcriptional regulator [Bdellovibrionota bacterium]
MKKNHDLEKFAGGTQCQLVESFWGFLPAFQRWAESCTTVEKLTPQRTRILAYLHEKGPQIMSALRDQLGVTATNITALIDALEKDELVARKSHPTDRRATIIEITPQAAQMLQGCGAFRQRVGELFSALSEEERSEMLRMMSILRSKLGEPVVR